MTVATRWVPRPCGFLFCKGGYDAARSVIFRNDRGPDVFPAMSATPEFGYRHLEVIGPWYPPLHTTQGRGTLSPNRITCGGNPLGHFPTIHFEHSEPISLFLPFVVLVCQSHHHPSSCHEEIIELLDATSVLCRLCASSLRSDSVHYSVASCT